MRPAANGVEPSSCRVLNTHRQCPDCSAAPAVRIASMTCGVVQPTTPRPPPGSAAHASEPERNCHTCGTGLPFVANRRHSKAAPRADAPDSDRARTRRSRRDSSRSRKPGRQSAATVDSPRGYSPDWRGPAAVRRYRAGRRQARRSSRRMAVDEPALRPIAVSVREPAEMAGSVSAARRPAAAEFARDDSQIYPVLFTVAQPKFLRTEELPKNRGILAGHPCSGTARRSTAAAAETRTAIKIYRISHERYLL